MGIENENIRISEQHKFFWISLGKCKKMLIRLVVIIETISRKPRGVTEGALKRAPLDALQEGIVTYANAISLLTSEKL